MNCGSDENTKLTFAVNSLNTFWHNIEMTDKRSEHRASLHGLPLLPPVNGKRFHYQHHNCTVLLMNSITIFQFLLTLAVCFYLHFQYVQGVQQTAEHRAARLCHYLHRWGRRHGETARTLCHARQCSQSENQGGQDHQINNGSICKDNRINSCDVGLTVVMLKWVTLSWPRLYNNWKYLGETN